MKELTIKKFKILLSTASGYYGFSCTFEKGLNIVRGNNSSGKSTFINALIYSFGMEELIGGKGIKVLPYALKDYIENPEKDKIKISSSYTFVEVQNGLGNIITLKRSIVSDEKDSKLIEIIEGPYLSKGNTSYNVTPTFLHDKGSAQDNDEGFFTYLERFIGIKLPKVAGSNGGEVKLYLQTIFSALLIEQKRGWTDYIANTPYYAIRDVKTKIAEFLLNFDVFENERIKSEILTEISQIQKRWTEEKYVLKLLSNANGILIRGVKENADDNFDQNLISLLKLSDDTETPIYTYIGELVKKSENIDKKGNNIKEDTSIELLNTYSEAKNNLDKLLSILDAINADIRVARSRIQEYESTLSGVEEELKKNKIALKLKKFGAEKNLKISKDICPTCHQRVDDSLILADTQVQPMSIDENIKYLESQRKMILRYISGLQQSIQKLNLQATEVTKEVSESRMYILSLKKDLHAFNSINESDLRLKIHLENKIQEATKAIDEIGKAVDNLKEISEQYRIAKEKLAAMPSRKTSDADFKKLQEFQHVFRNLANTFGYKSAPVNDIEINTDTLFPYLSGIELREVNTDIKSDSSASDFVRLIWAYLLSLYIVSNKYNGNHAGLIIFDEPAQHSMGVTSINGLFKVTSQMPSLQCIIAASFDESDEVFNNSTEGLLNYNLILLGDKLLKSL